MDLVVLIVVLGSAFGYVVAQSLRRRRPVAPMDPAESLRRQSADVPRASRFTEDRMGVIRTSRSFRSFPHAPLLVLVVVVLALVVLVNLPLL